MTIQALFKLNQLNDLFSKPVYTSGVVETPTFSRRDFGLEIDEAELASELSTCVPERFQHQSIPKVNPEDFERIYLFFLA